MSERFPDDGRCSQAYLLHAMIVRIQDENALVRGDHQGPRIRQFPFPATAGAPASERLPVEREFLDPVISQFADVHVSLTIQCEAIRVAELTGLRSLFTPEVRRVGSAVPVTRRKPGCDGCRRRPPRRGRERPPRGSAAARTARVRGRVRPTATGTCPPA